MYKICSRCKTEKELNSFHNNSKNLDEKNNVCKECRKEISKKSYIKKYDKEVQKQKNNRRKEYKSLWYKKDKRKNIEKYRNQWNKQNEKRREIKAFWFQENKERIIQKNLQERNFDPKKKINHLISSGILKSMKKNKQGRRWESLVGYSLEDLISHLFKDFDINEYDSSKYHIDHIIPIDAYSYTSLEDVEFKKCWSYRNLRLITREENLNKKNKIDKQIILEYNIVDLLPKEVSLNDL